MRCLAAAGPLFALLALAGCESEQYPTDLVYPLRTDPLVSAKPDEEPFALPPPGVLDEDIARIGKKDDKHPDGLSGKASDPKTIPPATRAALQKVLTAFFGTPARPRVGRRNADDLSFGGGASVVAQDAVLARLKIDTNTLAEGSKLYRRHCLHCHGLAGDGRGPAGAWLNPHPRDYRRGEFKFISTDPDGEGHHKPRREDLLRTLRAGIDGTSMPSFALLEEKNVAGGDKDLQPLEALASYVIHLSIRGQVEYELMNEILESGSYKDAASPEEALTDGAAKWLNDIASQWVKSDGEVLAPDPAKAPTDANLQDPKGPWMEKFIRRGYDLFTDASGTASCIGCHKDFGRQVNYRYDQVWGTLVRPANLTAGVYRGGRRPLDLYWRIRGGITPSGMAKTGIAKDKDEDVWAVVYFVRALPYPQMLPEDVRYKIYDRPGKE
jgi:mono/diheme cytochrome c family protein